MGNSGGRLFTSGEEMPRLDGNSGGRYAERAGAV